jgi:hypothetical protein
MTYGRWSVLSAGFREWWDQALVTEPSEVPAAPTRPAPAGEASLLLVVAAAVTAWRGTHLDFEMVYEPLHGSRFAQAQFIGDRWEATDRNGKHLHGTRHGGRDFGDRGLSFLLEPGSILRQGDIRESRTLADGTRALSLREPRVLSVIGRDGKLVRFKKPAGPWLHLADDVVVGNADSYRAILDPAAEILLRWDAVHGNRVLRRLELIDVTHSDRTRPDPCGA